MSHQLLLIGLFMFLPFKLRRLSLLVLHQISGLLPHQSLLYTQGLMRYFGRDISVACCRRLFLFLIDRLLFEEGVIIGIVFVEGFNTWGSLEVLSLLGSKLMVHKRRGLVSALPSHLP